MKRARIWIAGAAAATALAVALGVGTATSAPKPNKPSGPPPRVQLAPPVDLPATADARQVVNFEEVADQLGLKGERKKDFVERSKKAAERPQPAGPPRPTPVQGGPPNGQPIP
jgi:hypothetical protein